MGEAAEQFRFAISDAIRSHAMSFPESDEGSSCVNRAFKAGGKNFAFLGERKGEITLRLKVAESIPELEAIAAVDAERAQVGKGGWALLKFAPHDPPAIEHLRRWVTESFHILAPKKVIAEFNAT